MPDRQQSGNLDSQDAHQLRAVPSQAIFLCIALFVTLFLIPPIARQLLFHLSLVHITFFADDSFYYLVIAHHLAQSGQSTFDGYTHTNGYHPLWMAILTLQDRLFGQSLLLTRFIELLLGIITLVTTLLTIKLRSTSLNLVFTVGLFVLLSNIALNGMETTLFAAAYGLFFYISEKRRDIKPTNAWSGGILAIAVIASRIDAALFVLPHLFLVLKSRLERIKAFSLVLLVGVAYAAYNKLHFGVALPISSEAKSLGGLQINTMFLHSLRSPTKVTIALFYLACAAAIFTSLFRLTNTRPALQRVLTAFVLGWFIYVVRLTFFSGFVIFPWYLYPALLAYIAWAPVLLESAEAKFSLISFPVGPAMAIFAFLITVAGMALEIRRQPDLVPTYAIDQMALNQLGPHLNDERIAMGDRSGFLAYQYPGSVNQLEGLVNDLPYLQTLRSRGDVRGLLCQRNVKFILSYAPDLGNYDVHEVDTIRERQSSFPAPKIPVYSEDEIGRVSDIRQFNFNKTGDPASYLYLWRLRCSLNSPNPVSQ